MRHTHFACACSYATATVQVDGAGWGRRAEPLFHHVDNYRRARSQRTSRPQRPRATATPCAHTRVFKHEHDAPVRSMAGVRLSHVPRAWQRVHTSPVPIPSPLSPCIAAFCGSFPAWSRCSRPSIACGVRDSRGARSTWTPHSPNTPPLTSASAGLRSFKRSRRAPNRSAPCRHPTPRWLGRPRSWRHSRRRVVSRPTVACPHCFECRRRAKASSSRVPLLVDYCVARGPRGTHLALPSPLAIKGRRCHAHTQVAACTSLSAAHRSDRAVRWGAPRRQHVCGPLPLPRMRVQWGSWQRARCVRTHRHSNACPYLCCGVYARGKKCMQHRTACSRTARAADAI